MSNIRENRITQDPNPTKIKQPKIHSPKKWFVRIRFLGFGQNFERLLSRGEWVFCLFSFKLGGFDRVPEAL